MDISADFISSVLFTQESISIRNGDNVNEPNVTDNGPSVTTGLSTLPATDIQELHLLGIHFEEFDDLTSDHIRPLPPLETNPRFDFVNGVSSFDSDFVSTSDTWSTSANTTTPSSSNTDGAIYSFEVVSDNTVNLSPFWEDDNLSPITSALHQPSSFRGNSFDGDGSGDAQETTTEKDNQDANVLLRNALLGKTTFRYDTREIKCEPKTTTSSSSSSSLSSSTLTKPAENQNDQTRLEQVFSVVSKHGDTILPNINHRQGTDNLDQSSTQQQQQHQHQHERTNNLFRETAKTSSSTSTIVAESTTATTTTSSSNIDEILLADFDSFAYSNEQLVAINNVDIAQAIQQICNSSESNFISYVPLQQVTAVGAGAGAAAAPSAVSVDVTTSSSSPSLGQVTVKPKRSRRRQSKPNGTGGAVARAKLKSKMHANGSSTSPSSTTGGDHDDDTSSFVNDKNVATVAVSNDDNNNGGDGCSKIECYYANESGDISLSNEFVVSSGNSNEDYMASSSNVTTSNEVTNGPSSIGVRKERSLHHCFVCNKGFKDKYSVNVHIRTHTGEKPFSCTVCGKKFRQKAHLAKHHHTHFQKKTLPPSPTTTTTTSFINGRLGQSANINVSSSILERI